MRRTITAGLVALTLSACATLPSNKFDLSVKKHGDLLSTTVCVKNYGDTSMAIDEGLLEASAKFHGYIESHSDHPKSSDRESSYKQRSQGILTGLQMLEIIQHGDPLCAVYVADKPRE
jgi:hypothetical protein